MKERISKLIDVKSIVTFALTGAFVYQTVIGMIDPQIFITIYSTVIAFYFGTQMTKKP